MHALTHMSQTAGRMPVGLAAYAVTSAGTLASLAVLPEVEIHGLTGLSWLLLTVILVVVVARGSAAAWALSLAVHVLLVAGALLVMVGAEGPLLALGNLAAIATLLTPGVRAVVR